MTDKVEMTLDEAIKHCEEIACNNTNCALEHKQLAEWLKELRRLKSLPKEHNEDLEEAAEKYAFPEGKDKYEAESNGIYFREEKAKHFKAGAEWQKQQMMKDAVELHIVESFNPVGTENEKPHGFTALYYDAEYSDFYPVTGQTIKVISIKTEQQNEM